MSQENTQFVGVREFSQKLSQFLNGKAPVVLLKRGKPFRIVRELSPDESFDLEKNRAIDRILSHPAIGLWKKKWPKGVSSGQLVNNARKQEEARSSR